MSVDFTIDAGLLTNQPSEIEVTFPTASEAQASSGTWQATARNFGAEVKVTWGVDVAVTAVYAELRSARNSLVAHTITFNDPTGTSHTFSVNWLAEPPFVISVEQLYKRFSIVFHERPIDAA